jgi:hypothetical protein
MWTDKIKSFLVLIYDSDLNKRMLLQWGNLIHTSRSLPLQHSSHIWSHKINSYTLLGYDALAQIGQKVILTIPYGQQ